MASTTMSPPVKGGFKSNTLRRGDEVAKKSATIGVMVDTGQKLTIGEERDWPGREEFLRGREESSRILIAQGYTTDEAVMEMVAEEIRAYRKELAPQEAQNKK